MLRKQVGGRRRRERQTNCYEKMMKTLLLQNQQIIIQQQNMMFMVMKQLQPNSNQQPQPPQQQQHHQQQPQQQLQNQQQGYHQQQQLHQEEPTLEAHHLFSQANSSTTTTTTSNNISNTNSSLDGAQHQLQQVASQLHENLGNYLTPAASEQDPINDKPEEDDLVALLEDDGLLRNNLLYNPQTDIGQVTPYKSQLQQQHEMPSYYSSGCESLTTPRLEQQRQPTITGINRDVVKNLADSFKSPSKPKINVQILSGSATGSMKNSKAKIIQRMNISEFLRHVHPETDEAQKNSS